jgi:hypothetical protein
MRLLTVFGVLSSLVAIAACDVTYGRAGAAARPPAVPTAVRCLDAPWLQQQAVDERRRRDETRSDQEKIVAGGRATFYASLATIARLSCKTTLAAVEETLKPAFAAARSAQDTQSFYERAVHWADANFLLAQTIDKLMKQQE